MHVDLRSYVVRYEGLSLAPSDNATKKRAGPKMQYPVAVHPHLPLGLT